MVHERAVDLVQSPGQAVVAAAAGPVDTAVSAVVDGTAVVEAVGCTAAGAAAVASFLLSCTECVGP